MRWPILSKFGKPMSQLIFFVGRHSGRLILAVGWCITRISLVIKVQNDCNGIGLPEVAQYH